MIVYHHPGSPRDVAGQPEGPSVGIRSRQGELPGADSKPAGQLFADPGCVLGREHVDDAAAELALHGRDGRRGSVAGHGARVAKAKVDVVMAVDAPEMGARRRIPVQRERARPFDHPGHRDAVEERVLSPAMKLL